MNLNDPFGRLAQKDQAQYDALRQALKDEGINTLEAAEARQKTLLKRTAFSALLVIAIGALIAWLAPQWRPLVGLFGVVIVAWLAATTVKGLQFIRLYIRREIASAPADSSHSGE